MARTDEETYELCRTLGLHRVKDNRYSWDNAIDICINIEVSNTITPYGIIGYIITETQRQTRDKVKQEVIKKLFNS